jgi:hypothetical protein
MGLKLGLRVSNGSGDAGCRRHGFIIGHDPGSDSERPPLWVVRFEDGSEAAVAASALQVEVSPTALPVDALHEARFLPEVAQRAQLVFPFNAARHDFRRWFVEDIVRPAALEEAGCVAATALQLPAGARCPPRAGFVEGTGDPREGGGDDDEGTGRLLSNLHLTPAAGQRAQLIAEQCSQGEAGRVIIPEGTASVEGVVATASKAVNESGGGRVKLNATAFHTAFRRTLGASGKSADPRDVAMAARRARFDALLRRFVREVVAPLLGCGSRPEDVAYQARPTLRVSYPSGKAMGGEHCDFEYHHQPCELNFWCESLSSLPLTLPTHTHRLSPPTSWPLPGCR